MQEIPPEGKSTQDFSEAEFRHSDNTIHKLLLLWFLSGKSEITHNVFPLLRPGDVGALATLSQSQIHFN